MIECVKSGFRKLTLEIFRWTMPQGLVNRIDNDQKEILLENNKQYYGHER